MRDEHLVYADVEGEKIKVTPKVGYKMLCTLTKAYHSEAIITAKQENNFISVKK